MRQTAGTGPFLGTLNCVSFGGLCNGSTGNAYGKRFSGQGKCTNSSVFTLNTFSQLTFGPLELHCTCLFMESHHS